MIPAREWLGPEFPGEYVCYVRWPQTRQEAEAMLAQERPDVELMHLEAIKDGVWRAVVRDKVSDLATKARLLEERIVRERERLARANGEAYTEIQGTILGLQAMLSRLKAAS